MDEKTLYIINIGSFAVDGVTYTDRCLSASYGGQGVASEVIPWEGTEHNPWDYRALTEEVEETATDEEGNEATISVVRYTGEFVLEPIEIAPVEDAPTPQEDSLENRVTALESDTATLSEVVNILLGVDE